MRLREVLVFWSTRTCNSGMAGAALGRQAAAAGSATSTHDSSSVAQIPAIPTREARRPAHLELHMIAHEITGFPQTVRYLKSRFSTSAHPGRESAPRPRPNVTQVPRLFAVLRTRRVTRSLEMGHIACGL